MSMYGDSRDDENILYSQLVRFLENHKASELMTIVTDALKEQEAADEGY